ncbi:FDXHR family putative zinc-binding protein [Streptomyces sp. NPDC002754]
MAITHGECGKSWTGMAKAHCSGCHETFSTYGASDKHRIGSFGIDRRCAAPGTVGLVQRDGIWGYPAPEGGMRDLHATD